MLYIDVNSCLIASPEATFIKSRQIENNVKSGVQYTCLYGFTFIKGLCYSRIMHVLNFLYQFEYKGGAIANVVRSRAICYFEIICFLCTNVFIFYFINYNIYNLY
jgi:hypothetical protein